MESIRISFVALFVIIAGLAGCSGNEGSCANDEEFCALINAENFDGTGPVIDDYLEGLRSKLSDEEKLDRLVDWLECKSCVKRADIICNSCIYTNPPQSELKIVFVINEVQVERILDIQMRDPLLFSGFHN